jgi:hypothetical protein
VSDLVAFLRARLDEDESAAWIATPGPWRYNPNKHWRKPGTSWFEEAVFAGPPGSDAICVAGTGGTDDSQSMKDAAFIARHDPARVLREVEAKRRIIATATLMDADMLESWESVLRELASVYSNHPDYDPTWAVDMSDSGPLTGQ